MSIHFFDRVYQDRPHKAWEQFGNACEDYFYVDYLSELLGCKRFCIIPNQNKVEREVSLPSSNKLSKLLLSMVKLGSYLFLPVPLFFLIGKAFYRQERRFELLVKPANEKLANLHEKIPDSISTITATPSFQAKDQIPEKMVPKQQTEITKSKPEHQNPYYDFLDKAYSVSSATKEVRKLRDDKTFVRVTKKGHIMDNQMAGRTPAFQLMQEELSYNPLALGFLAQFDKKKQEQLLTRGGHISAHGVESMKGGIVSLLNIMLEGIIWSPWWGALQPSHPEWSAGMHGPFYVVLDSEAMERNENSDPRLKARQTDEAYHIAYIVPGDSQKEFINKALDKALAAKMLTKAEVASLRAKLMTYDEALAFSDTELSSSSAFKKAMANRERLRDLR